MGDAVLITGAAGFVGAALAAALVAEGRRVVAAVRDWTREPPGTVVARGDVIDPGFCRRLIADYEVREVFHLAAQSIVSVCAEDPMTALEVAVMGTAGLLQAVREADRPIKVVVSTSDKVYGAAPSPYDEASPLDARHAYEVSKACQDLVARMYHSNYGVDVRVVRAVNIYGPGDPNENRLVPQTILRCLRGDAPLIHDGADSMRRQYVYVDDAVAAFRLALARGAAGEAFCVGAPEGPQSALDVIREIARQAGVAPKQCEVRFRDARFREIAVQEANDAKLRALGWAPAVPFSRGIAKTIDWYRSQEIAHAS